MLCPIRRFLTARNAQLVTSNANDWNLNSSDYFTIAIAWHTCWYIRFSELCEKYRIWVVMTSTTVVWDITPCSPLKLKGCFGGIYRLHLHGRRINSARNQGESRWQIAFPSILFVHPIIISIALPLSLSFMLEQFLHPRFFIRLSLTHISFLLFFLTYSFPILFIYPSYHHSFPRILPTPEGRLGSPSYLNSGRR
jgi:hypothetical protein